MQYDWPGNIRELENAIEHAFILCRGGLIELSHLPEPLRSLAESRQGFPTGLTLAEMEATCDHGSLEPKQRQEDSGRQGTRYQQDDVVA